MSYLPAVGFYSPSLPVSVSLSLVSLCLSLSVSVSDSLSSPAPLLLPCFMILAWVEMAEGKFPPGRRAWNLPWASQPSN